MLASQLQCLCAFCNDLQGSRLTEPHRAYWLISLASEAALHVVPFFQLAKCAALIMQATGSPAGSPAGSVSSATLA
jgi:hypothetical protein